MKKNKISKTLLITCIVLTIIYTIIIIIPLFDIVGLTLSFFVDNEISLVLKLVTLFETIIEFGILLLPFYFLTRKNNKKKNVSIAILTEIIIGFSLCFLLWAMAPAICTNDNNGGQWETLDNKSETIKNDDNDLLICKFIDK